MSKHRPLIDFCIEDKRWERIPHLETRLEKAAEATLAHLPPQKHIPCYATLLLTTDATIKKLNKDFRGFNKITNVLSFPQFPASQLTKKNPLKDLFYLGDIAIAYQYVVDESKKDNKILINHVTHLLIHSLLHLFGYDHGFGAEAIRMESLEKKIMAGLGLPDPYALPQPAKGRSRTARRETR